MKHTFKNLTNIIDELITFYYCMNSVNMDIQIRKTDHYHYIYIKGDIDEKYVYKVDKLSKLLNTGRRPEIEQEYAFLVGQTDISEENELHLVAAMIDKANVKLNDLCLEIELIRYRDENNI